MNSTASSPETGDIDIDSINRVMRDQLDALASIEAILSAEHEALQSRDPQRLLDMVESKQQALQSLQQLEQQRRTLSADMNAQSVEQLREMAARCRDVNAANATLLSTQQQHVERLLTLLRGGETRSAGAYDAKGRNTATAPRRLRLTQV